MPVLWVIRFVYPKSIRTIAVDIPPRCDQLGNDTLTDSVPSRYGLERARGQAQLDP